MKIVFMGSSRFAIPTLVALSSHPQKFQLISVYSTPPKLAGRGLQLTRTPLHKMAEQLNLQVKTPASLKQTQLEECDAVVLAAYGKLLPTQILETPRYGCVNLHPSLLPRWRGATPIEHTLLSADAKTGISIMRMNEGLDEGDLLYQEELAISEDDDFYSLHDRLAAIGAQAMLKVLENIANIAATPQSQEGITYAGKISKEPIDWHWQAKKILGYIQALRGASAVLPNNKTIKILKAKAREERLQPTPAPGTVINEHMHIACLDGLIMPQEVQIPGKKPMEIEEFLRGNSQFWQSSPPKAGG